MQILRNLGQPIGYKNWKEEQEEENGVKKGHYALPATPTRTKSFSEFMKFDTHFEHLSISIL